MRSYADLLGGILIIEDLISDVGYVIHMSMMIVSIADDAIDVYKGLIIIVNGSITV